MDNNFVKSGLTIKFVSIYSDYQTFMDETRDPIYRTILTAFKDLKEKDSVIVNVIAKVEDVEFESNLEFTKLNLDILTTVINPYFESIEDYESCSEVMGILLELKTP
jgi:hypothetical protein